MGRVTKTPRWQRRNKARWLERDATEYRLRGRWLEADVASMMARKTLEGEY